MPLTRAGQFVVGFGGHICLKGLDGQIHHRGCATVDAGQVQRGGRETALHIIAPSGEFGLVKRGVAGASGQCCK